MGIKGLTALLKQKCPEIIISRDITDYKGKIVAVDASMILHQIVIASRGQGTDMTNDQGNLTSHLNGVFYKIINFLELGIRPVFVFDGAPSPLKYELLKKRKEIKMRAAENLKDEEMDEDERIKNFKKTFCLTQDHIQECRLLLDLMGIPHVTAVEEADTLCAYLSSQGFVDGICTEDMDILTFGGLSIYRGLINYSKKKKNEILEFNLDMLLEGLGMTYEQFVTLCVLLGCDYCVPIKYVGSVTAFKHVKEYENLKTIIDQAQSKKKHQLTDEHAETLKIAQQYFETSVDKIAKSGLNLRKFVWHKCHEDGLLHFMITKHNFSLIKIKSGISRLKKTSAMNKIVSENKADYKGKITKTCLFID